MRGEERRQASGHQASHQPAQPEQRDGATQPKIEPMRLHRFDATLVGERPPPEPQRVGDCQHRTDDQHGEGRPVTQLDQRVQRRLLADVAEHRRQPRHGRQRERGEPRQPGQRSGQAGQFAQIARPEFVVDGTDHQEQGGLEHGVRGQHRQSGQRHAPVAVSDQHHHETELRDCAESQQQLEVVLPQRSVTADDHRGQPYRENHRLPDREGREAGGQPGDQVDAGLHHRGGMQVGRDRGRGRHCRGQPEVERYLRRLGDRAQQDQHRRRRHQRRLGARPQHAGARVAHQFGQQERPTGHRPERHDAGEHGQATERGDDDGLHGRLPGGLALVVVADEQEAEDGGEFPEEVEDHRVVGRDKAEHRPGEGDEDTAEASQAAGAVPEIAPAVDQDQRTDTADDQDHQPTQRIEPERQIETQLGHPGEVLAGQFTAEDRPGLGQRPDRGGRRRQREQGERLAAEQSEQQRGHHSCDCVDAQQLDQGRSPM